MKIEKKNSVPASRSSFSNKPSSAKKVRLGVVKIDPRRFVLAREKDGIKLEFTRILYALIVWSDPVATGVLFIAEVTLAGMTPIAVGLSALTIVLLMRRPKPTPLGL